MAAIATAAGPARATALELELELARQPQLYLVVDLVAPSLEVRARGIVLDRTPLAGVAVAAVQPVVGRRSWPVLEPPLLWRVNRPPAADWRRHVAPTELRQYSESAAEDGGAVSTEPREVAELPARYAFAVDAGWEVMVGQDLEDGLWRQLSAAAADSWWRWRGRDQGAAPPRLALAMAPEDARRLLHLFQVDMPVLVVARPPHPSETGGAP